MLLEESVRLTSLAACAGCAAKFGPAALASMLEPLSHHHHSQLLLGLQTSDDAAVYRISDSVAVIQTIDFFTPIVDDPWTFGAIAAANSMSDVYAMGGDVAFALNVAAFPADLPAGVIAAILEGGTSKVIEAGGIVAGGHTIVAPEPVFGMSVTGFVHPEQVWTKSSARPGDVLFLSKPIGTGVLTTAAKHQDVDDESLARAVTSMLTLNKQAAALARDFAVNACTDVTGYSLAGHAFEMASKSRVLLEITYAHVPLLGGAREAANAGHTPGGLLRNREYYESHGVRIDSSLSEVDQMLCFDPQTSGGLLFAISVSDASTFEAVAKAQSLPLWRIGRVVAGSGVAFIP